MVLQPRSKISNQQTRVIEVAARALQEGFSMEGMLDFLASKGIAAHGDSTNTPKKGIAKLSLSFAKNRSKLPLFCRELIANNRWTYQRPVKTLARLDTLVPAARSVKRGRRASFSGPVISFSTLHPEVLRVSEKLYRDSHFPQAVLEAYKAIVNAVKKISGVKGIDGKSLMERVFSLGNPVIKLNNLQTDSEKDEQVGLMLLFSGAALGIRNPKAHENIVQEDPLRALEYLALASLLLKRLDERVSP
jgi:uncharacterized protein (TIGR02391 family)